MTVGIISNDVRGVSEQPSPSVFRSSPGAFLNSDGSGYHILAQFDGSVGTLPGLPVVSGGTSTFTYNSGALGNRTMDAATGTTANNSFVLSTRPLTAISKNGSTRIMFETEVAVTPADQGFFIGLVELAGLATGLVADGPGNGQTGLIGESLIGFASFQVSGATTKVDAVVRKDAGTVETVLADVTNASALNIQRKGANGRVTQEDLRGDLAAGVFRKFGVAVDRNTNRIGFYVDGVLVAEKAIDGTVDQVKEYAAAVSLKTGAAAAATMSMKYFRADAVVRV